MTALPAALAIIFVFSALSSFLFSPLAKRLATRAGAIAHPGERHIHDSPTPSWGGLGIIAGFLLAMLAGVSLFSLSTIAPRQLLGLSIGALLMLGMGLVDDRWHIPARYKVFGQIVAASLLPLFGIGITVISNPFSPGWLAPPGWLAWIITVAWVVGVTNAINLIDGIDGLASGVSAIACIALATIGVMRGQPEVALLAACLGGAAAGFLGWNFNPAKIFMGDSGAYFIGFIIGVITILGAFKIAASIAIFVPLLVLAVPLLEVGVSTLRRYLKGQPVFLADRDHLHHRLLGMGYSQRAVAIIMYVVTTICSIVAIWISRPW